MLVHIFEVPIRVAIEQIKSMCTAIHMAKIRIIFKLAKKSIDFFELYYQKRRKEECVNAVTGVRAGTGPAPTQQRTKPRLIAEPGLLPCLAAS